MKTSLKILLSLMFRRLFTIIELQVEAVFVDNIELTSKSLDSDIKSLQGIACTLDSGELVKSSSSSGLMDIKKL